MRTLTQGDHLLVTQFKNLGADNAFLFREFVSAALTPEHRFVDVDLAESDYIDSEGLGALISAHKRVCARQGRVRLLHARPMVRQFIELLRLQELFELVEPS